MYVLMTAFTSALFLNRFHRESYEWKERFVIVVVTIPIFFTVILRIRGLWGGGGIRIMPAYALTRSLAPDVTLV